MKKEMIKEWALEIVSKYEFDPHELVRFFKETNFFQYDTPLKRAIIRSFNIIDGDLIGVDIGNNMDIVIMMIKHKDGNITYTIINNLGLFYDVLDADGYDDNLIELLEQSAYCISL